MVCDVAYCLIVEAIERQVLADRQVVALARVMGGAGDVEMPVVADAVAEFHATIEAPPVPMDGARRELLEMLKVG
ncbi:MAG: hypothetical protein NVS3B26_16590 [Mycobacteriales bacterium]